MSSSRIQADYLTCSLCGQPFRQPKTLPCLHSFCKACLSTYLEQAMDGGRMSSFSCPECRKKIYVPDPSKAVNRWAAQFPTNFTLVGMIEALEQETKAKGRGVAMVREARERRGTTPDHDSSKVSPGGSRRDEFKKQNSKGKLSKDKSKDPNLAEDVQELLARLLQIQEGLCADKEDVDTQINSLGGHVKGQKRKLEKSFEKIYQLIEGRKKQLLDEMDINLVDEKDRLKQTQIGFDNDVESLRSCVELLEGLENKSISDTVALDMLEAIRDQAREIEARRSQVVAHNILFEQTLEAGRSVLNLIDDLGKVTVSTSGEAHSSKNNSRSGSRHDLSCRGDSFDSDGDSASKPRKLLAKPRFVTAISTKQSDGKSQQIFDITVTANGTIVMTSYGDNFLMAARNVGGTFKIISRLQLDSEPKCLVAIAPFFVAVVGSSCLYLVSVDEILSLKKVINTGKDYTGIAQYTESNLILACQRPACIDFVALNGFISETIDKDHTTGTVLFKSPQFLATSKDGDIFVTDLTRKPKLLSINNAGKIKFQFPPEDGDSLEGPQGVCCDSQGHIYVVDRGARKVILLTPAGQKVKDLLTSADGITDPCAIAVDSEDRIYVTNDFTEILVFKVK